MSLTILENKSLTSHKIFKSPKSAFCSTNVSHFLRGSDILTLPAHYLSDTQLYSDIWLHGDTLYPSISPFPPLVLRSLKVTSVWPAPVHFIAELYIWTPLVSLRNPPTTTHTPRMPFSRLIPPPPPHPTLFTAAATDSDSHKLPLQRNQLVLAG